MINGVHYLETPPAIIGIKRAYALLLERKRPILFKDFDFDVYIKKYIRCYELGGGGGISSGLKVFFDQIISSLHDMSAAAVINSYDWIYIMAVKNIYLTIIADLDNNTGRTNPHLSLAVMYIMELEYSPII